MKSKIFTLSSPEPCLLLSPNRFWGFSALQWNSVYSLVSRRRTSFPHTLAVILFILNCIPVFAADREERLPVPNPAARMKAAQIAEEAYRSQYTSAKTPQRKINLAKRLRSAANKSNVDADLRYVLLTAGRDIALQGGDLSLAYEIVDDLSASYAVDGLSTKVELAQLKAEVSTTASEVEAVVDILLSLVDDAVRLNRYQVAESAQLVAMRHAVKAAPSLRQKVANVGRDIKLIANEYAAVKPAFERLEESANDPVACAEAGSFLCFLRDDWEAGVQLLAKGEDKMLRDLARLEIGSQRDLIQAGDAWLEFAENNLQGRAKSLTESHAIDCYRKALRTTTGVAKAKLEERLLRLDAPDRVTLPVVKSRSGWVDCLARIEHANGRSFNELVEHGDSTSWSLLGDGIATTSSESARIKFPMPFPEQYDLAIDFSIQDRTKRLTLYLPYEGRRFVLHLRGDKRGTRLYLKGGVGPEDPRVSTQLPGVDGPLRMQVVVYVRESRVAVEVANRTIIDVADIDLLSLDSKKDLAISTVRPTVIHSMKWRESEDGGGR